jgi:anti-sigma regulatory factor (Ser/Thr protein kinase)
METAITELGVTRRFRRVAEAIPATRAFVRRWLPPVDAGDRLVMGAAEAINNVIDHADGDHFTVAVDLDGTTGTVTVIDDGPGFDVPAHPTMPGPLDDSHRGLPMMHVLVDRVVITADSDGTTVVLTQGFADVARAAVA